MSENKSTDNEVIMNVNMEDDDDNLLEKSSSIDKVQEDNKSIDDDDDVSINYNHSKIRKTLQFIKSIEPYISTIIFTLIAFKIREFGIELNNKVVWDEAHFAKFGSYYLKHEFYHDVHPPLGKMLCGLSEYLAGYNGSSSLTAAAAAAAAADVDNEVEFKFESGKSYPDSIDYKTMRLFNVFAGSLCVPICFLTSRLFGFGLWGSYLIGLMCCFENSFITLSKFVLLDSFLLVFTCCCFYCLGKLFQLRDKEGTLQWCLWMMFTGLSIGCVCSVKWVGLFVTALIGLFTIFDLWLKFWDTKNFKWTKYLKSWIYRICYLIILPLMIYTIMFKIHFSLLYKPGSGSGSMSSIFQANLQDSDILKYPRNIQLNSKITMRSHGLSSNLIHSHPSLYPSGSTQQQITTYGFKDANNDWFVKKARNQYNYNQDDLIRDGDIVRFQHVLSNVNLHSHLIHGHVSKEHWEVSGYGDDNIGDSKDDWKFEIVNQLKSSNKTYSEIYESNDLFNSLIHPLSTTFRLKHVELGCYLATTGKSYPTWGFKQGEVICKSESILGKFDKSTWWNVETHIIESLQQDDDDEQNEQDEYYEYPKNQFFSDFISIQFAMMATNNALTVDPDKYDSIASEWWEWPILRQGLRMCGWSPMLIKYYLLGNPFTTWFSTLCIIISIGLILNLSIRWQRQNLNKIIKFEELEFYIMRGLAPFIGWLLHYLPFAIMGRVTYYHHYMPALYFAFFSSAFIVELFCNKFINRNPYGVTIVYLCLYIAVLYSYWLFSPLCLGMKGPPSLYSHLDWLPTWTISRNIVS
ncbi:glycosyltransferase family 39 protein [[Candida] arabinofermentans NRRL YB-2248]|uniref:Dolichyl-phosphate-mannose--protein mannosyltransferase n=1 Tax=[Candida] arabinofermentans NRRL YB-2248 TaxID=983967 RepID=A0A1E4STE6_9ASCO|nr:glycosyltransferase family 39 protein [[Candida] arabinofermentans NRRL YB-2248]